MNKHQIEKICDAFDLGIALDDPIPVSGGLIHRMWKMNTNRGSFAIKELDAAIMQRPGIQESYIQSEKIASLLKSQQIPAATAIIHHQTLLYETDRITVMVFPWIEGKTLALSEVTTEHTKQIGKIVASIHKANIKLHDLQKPEIHFISEEHWYSLMHEALNNQLPWAAAAKINLPNLIAWSHAYQKAKQQLNKQLIISHKDIDPKNVLWCNDTSPVLIDWEGAGFVNPTEEIINVAMEWAGMTEILFRETIFSAVIEGYCNNSGHIIESEMHDALYGLIGNCLAWLEFNMSRSLDSKQFDSAAQKLGIEETEMTLKKLNFLAENMDRFQKLIQATLDATKFCE